MITKVKIINNQSLAMGGIAALLACSLFVVVFLPVFCLADAGDLDPTFGTNGKVTSEFPCTVPQPYPQLLSYNMVAIQSDGKIVVVGHFEQPSTGNDFALARFNSDGSTNNTFGSNGRVTTDFALSNDIAFGVAIQSDGKIVVVGRSDAAGTGYDFALARYNSDGSLDTDFGTGGRVTFGHPSFHEVAHDVAIQSDGKIVAAGFSVHVDALWEIFTLTRYNSDGSPDKSFGSDGRVTTIFFLSRNGYPISDLAYCVAVQSDGKIVAAGGSYQTGTGYDFALARYNSDGSLDNSFDSDGLVTTHFGSVDFAYDVAIQDDGKIVLVGHCGGNFALARYNSDGSLDNSFGSDGRVTTDFGSIYDIAYSVAIQDDGKIVAAGGWNLTSALARYESGVNQPPVVAADLTPIIVDEGQTAANTGTVSDPDNDPVTLTASIGSVTNNGDGTWSWSFPTSDGPAESQTVTITADDGKGGTAETTFELTVNNVAPTIDVVTVPLDPVDINNQPISASATFNDPGGTLDEPYMCTFDYGDETAPVAGTVNGTSCAGPDHSYAEAGVYAVTVTVTDKDGGSGSKKAADFIVIYDPDGGFVTGGGWIESPEGAYAADPDLTGKANFGFVSKYKKGATVPTGNTEFQFKAGDLNFHSDSYDWLVIAGARVKYKGVGTINGAGNYGFMLTATDAELTLSTDVDLFRIKIWNKDDNDAIIYDNKMGSDDDGYAGTEIGGGDIKIHQSSVKEEATNDSETELASTVIPENYGLEQNFPNPFNPITEISFALPKAANVHLAIYNSSGQLVRILMNAQVAAGCHTVTWDATNENGMRVSSGIYVYVLKANEVMLMKKMIVTK